MVLKIVKFLKIKMNVKNVSKNFILKVLNNVQNLKLNHYVLLIILILLV